MLGAASQAGPRFTILSGDSHLRLTLSAEGPLRHLKRCRTRRPCFRAMDRLFWVFLSWWWPGWAVALTIIKADTVLGWRRQGISTVWKYRSHGRWRGGRPRIAAETRQLIREMARANFLWGAPRIHGELLKLGFTVSQATVSRYMLVSHGRRRSQTWRTFLRNQASAIVCSRTFEGHGGVNNRGSWSRVVQHYITVSTGTALAGLSYWKVWYLSDAFRLAVTHRGARCRRSLTAGSTVATRGFIRSARNVERLTTDRIRGPPQRIGVGRLTQNAHNKPTNANFSPYLCIFHPGGRLAGRA